MARTMVIDQPTQMIVTTPVYVSGENVPAVRASTQLRFAGTNRRGLTIESSETVRDQQRLAQDASMALHEWNEHAVTCRRLSVPIDSNLIHSFVDRIERGIEAWVRLDVDSPSNRTIAEYKSNIRDLLIYLALNDLAPIECGSEDMKAFKMFLQGNGAVAEMERLRARWYGRAERVLYRFDGRDVVVWALAMGAVKARSNRSRAQLMRGVLAVLGSFETQPRADYREHYSPDTVALKMTVIRVFFNMAIARGVLFANPAMDISVKKSKTSREDKIRSRMFSWDEVKALLDSCSDEAAHSPVEKAKACRDRCMIAMGAVLGLRISEVVGLDIEHFHPSMGESGALFIKGGKGNKDRWVDLTEKMKALIEKWLMYRNLTNTTSPALFISLHRGGAENARQPFQRMDARGVRMMFDERQKALGIKREGRSFHGLRHRYATRAIDKGASLFRVSKSMGHAGISTTQIYVDIAALEHDNPAKMTDDVL